MLRIISYRFGVMQSGHPGVKSETQLRSLAPYIHLLSPESIGNFCQKCNERGWFTIRRELFDNFLQPPHLRYKWEPNQARASLDDMLKEDRLAWLEHWIDKFLKIGVMKKRL